MLADAGKTLSKVGIENCHNNYGGTPETGTGTIYPTDLDACPYTFFRSSADIHNEWSRIVYNLQTTVPFLTGDAPLSRPVTTVHPIQCPLGKATLLPSSSFC